MSDALEVPTGEVVYDPAGNVTIGAPAARAGGNTIRDGFVVYGPNDDPAPADQDKE